MRIRLLPRREATAGLTRGERGFVYAWSVFGLLITPAALLLTIYGHGTARTVGIALLFLALLYMAVPISPFLGARRRRRERAGGGEGER